MAAASYTTDLVTLTASDATTGFAEPTGSTAGGTPVLEADYFIQGTNCISKTFNATGIGGLTFTTTAVVVPTDGAVYIWAYFSAPNAISTKALGGKQILVGSSVANYSRYYVSGSDTYTYGGWVNYPINPTSTASATVGVPTGITTTFGYAVNVVNAISKGNPFGVDAMRYGRGSIDIINGDLANGYGGLFNAATTNDLLSNRWGILSFVDGGYKLQGRLGLGTSATPVDFRDSNKSVTIQNTEYVTSAFNSIEVLNTASNVSLTNISIQSLSTVSRGSLLVTDNASVLVDSCTFTDMGSFSFLPNTTITDTTFRRCGLITHGNSSLIQSLITRSFNTVALITNNPTNLQDNQFISAGSGHAIEITTPGTYTFSGNAFEGYGLTGTTNAAIYNNSGGAVVLNIAGGGDTPTYLNGLLATTTIVSSNTVTFSGVPSGSDMVVLTAGTNAVLYSLDSASTFVYTYSGSQTVDVGFIKQGYVPYYIRNLTLTTSDSSIPVAMTADRNFI